MLAGLAARVKKVRTKFVVAVGLEVSKSSVDRGS